MSTAAPPEIDFAPETEDNSTRSQPLTDALYEVIDGRIVEMPSKGSIQEFLAGDLYFFLAQFVRQKGIGRAFVESLFDFSPQIERKRRPDLAFLSKERWALEKPITDTDGLKVVPNLAIEIVSKTNSWEDINEKTVEYLSVGVERVWVISARQRQVHIYDGSANVRLLKESDVLTDDLLPGFELNLSELFSIGGPKESA